jgi:hypothetical protein
LRASGVGDAVYAASSGSSASRCVRTHATAIALAMSPAPWPPMPSATIEEAAPCGST